MVLSILPLCSFQHLLRWPFSSRTRKPGKIRPLNVRVGHISGVCLSWIETRAQEVDGFSRPEYAFKSREVADVVFFTAPSFRYETLFCSWTCPAYSFVWVWKRCETNRDLSSVILFIRTSKIRLAIPKMRWNSLPLPPGSSGSSLPMRYNVYNDSAHMCKSICYIPNGVPWPTLPWLFGLAIISNSVLSCKLGSCRLKFIRSDHLWWPFGEYAGGSADYL